MKFYIWTNKCKDHFNLKINKIRTKLSHWYFESLVPENKKKTNYKIRMYVFWMYCSINSLQKFALATRAFLQLFTPLSTTYLQWSWVMILILKLFICILYFRVTGKILNCYFFTTCKQFGSWTCSCRSLTFTVSFFEIRR